MTSIAAIAKHHGSEVYARSSPQQRRALEKIVTCKTAAQGVHWRACDHCDHRHQTFNSCRSRYCPRCLRGHQGQWFDARLDELLEVPYFHVVFTLPQELAALALQNQQALYTLLFHAASRTLLELGEDPKRLGGQLGFLMVLHTWGQSLRHHPHVHCVVPGGGLAPGKTGLRDARWISSRSEFLFPVQVLSKLFRGKYLAGLRKLFDDGELEFHGKLSHLANRAAFDGLLRKLWSKGWIVYSKPPFAGPKQVLGYLARYTHRIAISDSRITRFDERHVTFRWKDYSDGARTKLMRLDAAEFLRRYLLHVLPQGFHRLRYYGFYGNRHRKSRIALCRRLLARAAVTRHTPLQPADCEPRTERSTRGIRCPKCGGPVQVRLVSRPHPGRVRPFSLVVSHPT